MEKSRTVETISSEDSYLAPKLVAQAQFKLSRWPDFRKMSSRPEYVKIAVTIQNHTRTLAEIAEHSKRPIDEVIDFIDACYANGYLVIEQSVGKPASAQSMAKTTQDNTSPPTLTASVLRRFKRQDKINPR